MISISYNSSRAISFDINVEIDILKFMKFAYYIIICIFVVLIPSSVLCSDETAGSVDWRWLDFDEAFESDIGDGKHLIVNFYSIGCFWCKKMDNLTFTDPIISNMLDGGFVGAKVNIASNRKVEWMGDVISERELARIFAVRGTPNTAFVDSTGKIVARVPGYIDPERFKIVLKYIDGYWYNELSFQEYLVSEKALQSGSNQK